jgi:hypothetical protein
VKGQVLIATIEGRELGKVTGNYRKTTYYIIERSAGSNRARSFFLFYSKVDNNTLHTLQFS